MVAPFVAYGKELNLPKYRKITSGIRQAKPYSVDTPLEVRIYEESDAWAWTEDTFVSLVQRADNEARNRLVGQLGDVSSFGATATAEARQTSEMITSLLIRAAKAAGQVRKLDLFGAARTLGFPYTEKVVTKRRRKRLPGYKGRKTVIVRRLMIVLPDGRMVAKSLAGGWLWYSYGVKPLMEDIYNGMEVLTRPIPMWQQVVGTGQARDSQKKYFDEGFPWWSIHSFSQEASTRCKCIVTVNNPNVHLANQLGLLNPVQWINEAIPFSFVVDWFSNLSQVISQLTDFAGLTVDKPITTRRFTGTEGIQHASGSSFKKFFVFKRKTEIPTAKLQFAYERFSWQRGLNAISLLIGFTRS
jgi:hypothetical protein